MKSEQAFGRFGAVLSLLVGLSSAACGSTTTFASSWRSPTAEPLNMKGEKVAAVVMMQNDATRRNAEDVLAREITHHGAKGVPMYTLLAGSAMDNEAAARAALEGAGVKGAVVMRPMGTKKRTETHESYSSPMYNGYWGGYYPYGWGSAYGPPHTPHGAPMAAAPAYATPALSNGPYTTTSTTTTEVIQVEVLVYSLKQNLLVWAGVSETTESDKIDPFVTQVAAETARELGRMGLLSN